MQNVNREKRIKNYKVLKVILKTVSTFVLLATISSSVTISITDFSPIAKPIFTGIACRSTLPNKVVVGIKTNKQNKNRKL